MTPTALRAAAALGIVVLLAACGSSKASTGAAAATEAGAATTTTTTNDNNAYRTCLSEHGVTLPNRGPRPTGGTSADSAANAGATAASPPSDSGPPSSVDAATQAAFQACASLRPANGFRGANSQAMQAYVSCLKDNGVQVADTTASSGPPPSFDRSSPAFAAADAKCHVLLPQRPDRTTTTTTAAP